MLTRVVIHIILISCLSVVFSIEIESKLYFAENIINSLDENLFGNCKWNIAYGLLNKFPIDSDILIIPQLPSAAEIISFLKVPRTLTRANKDLGIGMVKVCIVFRFVSCANMRCDRTGIFLACRTFQKLTCGQVTQRTRGS